MRMPPRLYKYEAFSTQSLLNLKRQIIYFGSPLNFNDPYDCALTPNLQIPSDAEVEDLRRRYLERPDLHPATRQQFETFSVARLRRLLMRSAEDIFRQTVDDFLAKRGVACFSERNDDLLMWAHYGGHYKGFCLEFDTAFDPFEKIRPVRYVPAPPPLDILQVLSDGDVVSDLFCTKSAAWAYEQEWRAIHHVAGTAFTYPAQALTGVYFGPDIDRQTREVLCLVLAGQNERVQLWQGVRSSSEFRVSFAPLAYASHREAQQR